MTTDTPNAPTCCMCSGAAVARALDREYRKPVCAAHRSLCGELGYPIVALSLAYPVPPEEG